MHLTMLRNARRKYRVRRRWRCALSGWRNASGLSDHAPSVSSILQVEAGILQRLGKRRWNGCFGYRLEKDIVYCSEPF